MAFIKNRASNTKFLAFDCYCDNCGHEYTYLNWLGSKLGYRPYTHLCFKCLSSSIFYRKIN